MTTVTEKCLCMFLSPQLNFIELPATIFCDNFCQIPRSQIPRKLKMPPCKNPTPFTPLEISGQVPEMSYPRFMCSLFSADSHSVITPVSYCMKLFKLNAKLNKSHQFKLIRTFSICVQAAIQQLRKTPENMVGTELKSEWLLTVHVSL